MLWHETYKWLPFLYCIARNFCKLAENKIFAEKTFTDCLLVPPKDTMPPNVTEKTFVNSHKNSKFAKVFSLKSFPLYGILFNLNWVCAWTCYFSVPDEGTQSFFQSKHALCSGWLCINLLQRRCGSLTVCTRYRKTSHQGLLSVTSSKQQWAGWRPYPISVPLTVVTGLIDLIKLGNGCSHFWLILLENDITLPPLL